MVNVHITFPLDQFHRMVAAFEMQFTAQSAEVTVLDFGCSYKQEVGYLVLEWMDEVDESFLRQLTADRHVVDFSVYRVPCADDPFCALTAVRGFLPTSLLWHNDEMSTSSFDSREHS